MPPSQVGAGAAGCASCGGGAAGGEEPSVEAAPEAAPRGSAERFNQLLAKKQSGALFTEEELAELAEFSAKSDKGLITVSAGVAVTVRREVASTGPVREFAYSKVGGEVNSDQGLVLKDEGGVELKGATGKVKVRDDGVLVAEQDLVNRRLGPAEGKIQLFMQDDLASERVQAAGVKAKGAAKVPVGTKAEVEGEVYVSAQINNLNDEEKRAMGARGMMNAHAMQAQRERQMAGFEAMEARKAAYRDEQAEAAAKAAWQRRVTPPEPPMVGGIPLVDVYIPPPAAPVVDAPPPPPPPAYLDTGTPHPQHASAGAV